MYFGLPPLPFSLSEGGDGLLGIPRESGEGTPVCNGVRGEKVGAEGVSGETPVDSGAIGSDTTDEEGELEKKDLGPRS